ncbi:MAG: SDR family oxidoreductase [Myxococcaceae bacterium]|nr:SDR family oxidoreductase [Myxococcaceae bacterium]MCI0671797.1 SDR family oxidoreductase [Myxococcaceae bacterium]
MSAPLLEGRVALVTGASRGIGRAVAVALAEAGADLVLTSTRDGGTDEVRVEVERSGRQALGVAADVGRPGDVDRLVSAALSRFGRVDVLVNNAGVVVRRPLAEMRDADFTDVVATNLTGPFLLARRLVPGMVQRRWGRVVNVGSISGTLGTPGLSGYCASKWGLNGLTKSLAEELKGTGVTVTAVLPGSVDTDMLKGSGYAPAMTPDEVARVVRFLCAEAPEAMTGSLVEMFG